MKQIQDIAKLIDGEYKIGYDPTGKIIFIEYDSEKDAWTKKLSVHDAWMKFSGKIKFCEMYDFKIAAQIVSDLNQRFSDGC